MANQACGPFRKRMGSRRNFHSWWEWTEWLHVLAFVKTGELKKQTNKSLKYQRDSLNIFVWMDIS